MKKFLRFISLTALAAGMLLFSGCATKRGVVALNTPVSQSVAKPKDIAVHIRSVTDNREFEVAPKQPNIPSLDPKEASNASIKARAIARKRNSWGQALGDILLEEGQSVNSVTKEAVAKAFRENGYTVIEEKNAVTPDTYLVDVSIDKFWSWMNPGFWAITLSTEISTDINVEKPGSTQKESVYVKASDSFQTGMEGNYMEVMQEALRLYIDEVKKKF